MSENFLNFTLLSLAFLMLFAMGEFAYHKMKIAGENTRKFIHAGTGLLTLTFPFLFESTIWVFLLCLTFLLILLASKHFNFLKSINDINRFSFGSILYPIIVVLIFIFSKSQVDTLNCFYFGGVSFFYIPILIMALADPSAALVGKNYPLGPYKIRNQTKTFSGSLAFFFVAALVCCIFIKLDFWWLILLLSFLTTLVEGLSKNGFDNFSIPFAAALILLLFV
jgi:dolichol kinase